MVFEIIIVVIVLLILFLALALFRPVRFRAELTVDNERTDLKIFMLYPLFNLNIFMKDGDSFVSAYFLKLRVYRSKLGERKKAKINLKDLILSADIFDVCVDTYLGLDDPFATGMACGVFGMISSLLRPDKMNLYPSFVPGESYIHIDAAASINIGNTIVNFAENKKIKHRRKFEWSKT